MTTQYIAIECRIYPTDQQKSQLIHNFGTVRFIWNQMLGMLNTRYANNKDISSLSVFDMNYLITSLKVEYPWLKESDSTSLQQTNAQLADAFKRFFKGQNGYPRFKSRKTHAHSYKTTSSIKILSSKQLQLPKLGKISYKSRQLPDTKVKSATIKQSPNGHYYAVLLFEHESQVLQKTHREIGIDLGVSDLAIGSDGLRVPSVRFDKALHQKKHQWEKKAARRLIRAKNAIVQDKKLAVEPLRTLLDFKNYQKARRMVATYHAKIANQRKDYLHKLSKQLVVQYDLIAIENLRAGNMMKNHNLARAIANQSWYELRMMLTYKCERYGKELKIVNPYKTSQICSSCHYDSGKKPLHIREWTCPSCAVVHDRDINAAKNILHLGLGQTLVN